MKIKTSELTGIALDWAVTKAIGEYRPIAVPSYSTDWAHAGLIIEREKINTAYHPDINCMTGEVFPCWIASIVTHGAEGPTPLIAAMRCYVASKLGKEVDVPDELVSSSRNEVQATPGRSVGCE